VIAAYLGLGCFAELTLAAARRRSGLVPRFRGRIAVVAAAAALALVVALVLVRSDGERSHSADVLSVRVLDVGQGDAILLDPPGGAPLLVDAGPPGSAVEERLRELGIDSLAAAVITHEESDHAGGLGQLLDSISIERIAYGLAGPTLRRLAAVAGSSPLPLAEGGGLDSGGLRLTALWPPPELTGATPEDPNRLSLVLLAEWRHFSMLLSGDAEAEAVPIDPGPVDVLKVAHHGSADAGLDSLLDRAVPKLAVISVGARNPFGHPTGEVLATLRQHGVSTLRTDEAGEVTIEAGEDGWRVVG
jgi:competence protein ComEC